MTKKAICTNDLNSTPPTYTGSTIQHVKHCKTHLLNNAAIELKSFHSTD